ncbi:hypothetical protein BGZ65_003630 [Modicella reniformis]|uniref:Uncharacterized protein n=1 Tax=Modicella reniformis TaxID=1440133 RepID=A0A9P6M976_9FUNG|nr:hypothetical protein BGZ65_003630 [Modicella reniformis]
MIIVIFSALVQLIDVLRPFSFRLVFPSVITPALSVVIGLILAFRTNTAYDRFWEGRKLWASLDVQIRNFSRMIWVGMKEVHHTSGSTTGASTVSLTAADPTSLTGNIGAHLFGRSPSKSSNRDPSAALAEFNQTDNFEKVLVIKLLLAFAVSVKHHLRQEFGTRYYDLEFLFPDGFVPCAATDNVEIKVVDDKALGDRSRHYSKEPWTIQPGNDDGQMSLPLEITYALSLWVLRESRAERIEGSLVGNLLGSINVMTDVFTNMERIVFTPIPLAYSIHLRQVVYLYCLALPFTFIEVLGWNTVLLMCLVAFTLFGIEGIGREIENPFGKDSNDLHMDQFCRDLKRELEYLVNLKNTVPGAQ